MVETVETLVEKLATKRVLGALLESVRQNWGSYDLLVHHQQGQAIITTGSERLLNSLMLNERTRILCKVETSDLDALGLEPLEIAAEAR